jgi:HTH-type transcriptional regulator/antitoxin HipB
MHLRTPTDIGAIIRERRRALGLDQGELAKRVGVSRLWINQIERGKPRASLNLVLRTLSTIGVELIADSEVRPPQDLMPVTTPDINAIVQAARSNNRNKQ